MMRLEEEEESGGGALAQWDEEEEEEVEVEVSKTTDARKERERLLIDAGWKKVMDYGKLKGYRPPSGGGLRSLAKAWREYSLDDDDDDEEDDDDVTSLPPTTARLGGGGRRSANARGWRQRTRRGRFSSLSSDGSLSEPGRFLSTTMPSSQSTTTSSSSQPSSQESSVSMASSIDVSDSLFSRCDATLDPHDTAAHTSPDLCVAPAAVVVVA